jgi:hypothetical protein
MATMRSNNNNEAITHLLALTKSPIPILVLAVHKQRDGRSIFPVAKLVRRRERKVFQGFDVRIIPSKCLAQFIDSRERDKFEKEFGQVSDSDRKELVYLIGLAAAISAGQGSSKVDYLERLRLAASSRAEGNREFELHLLSEAYETPGYAICKLLNRGIQNSRFIVWWVDRDQRLAPGLYCPDAVTALFALALAQVGETGALAVCSRCSNQFLTRRSSQVYCSSKCQTAAAMTRYRANQKTTPARISKKALGLVKKAKRRRP